MAGKILSSFARIVSQRMHGPFSRWIPPPGKGGPWFKMINFPATAGRKDCDMELLYNGEKVGEIMTNRSLSLEDCFDLLGIDINAQEGGDPMWDYDLFEMVY